jgi:hypothetical protein
MAARPATPPRGAWHGVWGMGMGHGAHGMGYGVRAWVMGRMAWGIGEFYDQGDNVKKKNIPD